MSKKQIHEIIEQSAVYDGKPNFAPPGMAMSILNYHALGGTLADAEYLRTSGEAPNATLYKVRIIIETEVIEP